MKTYQSHPWHLLFPIAMILGGAASVAEPQLRTFTVLMYLMGAGSGLWIIVSGLVDAYVRYWGALADFVRALPPSPPPEVWKVLGVKEVARIEVSKLDAQGYGSSQTGTLPCSPHQLQTFSDGVLMGRGMGEGVWSGPGKLFTAPEFRAFKKELEARKYIRLRMEEQPRQGFVETKKGRELFMKYASPGIVSKLQEDINFIALSPPPLMNGEAPKEA